MSRPILIAVVGPTGIGKTKLAITLAQHYQTEILSADSRQFYKEMQIGTAVPSQDELSLVIHHFIQHKSVHEPYSVGDFERDALFLLDGLFNKHPVVVMVGGSGLYVDAVVKGLDDFPKVDEETRKTLVDELKSKGLEALQDELQRIDPSHFQKIDKQNPHRVIRALEVYRASGRPYSSFLGKKKSKRPFKTVYVGIEAERETIYGRINARVDQMMADGLLEEVKNLYPHKSLNALQTVGYQELFAYFDDAISLQKAIEEIKKNTRRFAKRQLTWYRKNDSILWVNYNDSKELILKKVNEGIKTTINE